MEKGFQVSGVDGSKKLLNIANAHYPAMKTIHGDVRTVILKDCYDVIIEWWCLFHIPRNYHEKMIARFAAWLKPKGMLEFTTGDREYEATNSDMLNQPLSFYSLAPEFYEKALKRHGFKLLFRENDQPEHLVWIAQKVNESGKI